MRTTVARRLVKGSALMLLALLAGEPTAAYRQRGDLAASRRLRKSTAHHLFLQARDNGVNLYKCVPDAMSGGKAVEIAEGWKKNQVFKMVGAFDEEHTEISMTASNHAETSKMELKILQTDRKVYYNDQEIGEIQGEGDRFIILVAKASEEQFHAYIYAQEDIDGEFTTTEVKFSPEYSADEMFYFKAQAGKELDLHCQLSSTTGDVTEANVDALYSEWSDWIRPAGECMNTHGHPDHPHRTRTLIGGAMGSGSTSKLEEEAECPRTEENCLTRRMRTGTVVEELKERKKFPDCVKACQAHDECTFIHYLAHSGVCILQKQLGDLTDEYKNTLQDGLGYVVNCANDNLKAQHFIAKNGEKKNITCPENHKLHVAKALIAYQGVLDTANRSDAANNGNLRQDNDWVEDKLNALMAESDNNTAEFYCIGDHMSPPGLARRKHLGVKDPADCELIYSCKL